jgi:hypothetical protein
MEFLLLRFQFIVFQNVVPSMILEQRVICPTSWNIYWISYKAILYWRNGSISTTWCRFCIINDSSAYKFRIRSSDYWWLKTIESETTLRYIVSRIAAPRLHVSIHIHKLYIMKVVSELAVCNLGFIRHSALHLKYNFD